MFLSDIIKAMNLKEKTDEEIWELIENNPEYFGEIIDRYTPKLKRYIQKLTNISEDEKEDILQDVFLTIYQNYYYFENGEKFSSWIYKITHNKTIDYWKKNGKNTSISIDDNLSFVESIFWENNILENLQKQEESEILKKIFQKLPLKYKEIFILRFDEGKSYEEISEILEIPKSSVGTLIKRTKEKLKEEYYQMINKK